MQVATSSASGASKRSAKLPRRITLEDVARQAGVSRATASLVVRESPLVADETRERVLTAMDTLGYVHNRAAASLRSQRSNAIGLVITDITNPFFAELTTGIEAVLEEAECAVLLGNTSERVDKQDRLLSTMHSYAVDGVLLMPAVNTAASTVERLHRLRIPFVMLVRYLRNVNADYVGADNIVGAEMAAEHLVQLGHRKIAFIGGSDNSSARQDRVRGLRNVLHRHGIYADEALFVTAPVSREGGRLAVRNLLAQENRPTAALCYNDLIAFGVMLELRSQGIQPGEDFAVIGFDDVEEAALSQPALTTVAINSQDIGAAAARLLLERIESPDAAPKQIIVQPKLQIRESCCAPRH